MLNIPNREVDLEKEIYWFKQIWIFFLYFGLEIKNSYRITEAPKYTLGDYLNTPNHKFIL